MGEDDVRHRRRVDVEKAEGLDRAAQEGPLAADRDLLPEAGVDDHRAPVVHRPPHAIVHRHRTFMGIAADALVPALRVARGVASGEELVFGPRGVGHPYLTFGDSIGMETWGA